MLNAQSSEEVKELQQRVSELEMERDALQAQLDNMENAATSRWLKAVQYESALIRDIHNSLSWKVTKPLRTVRTVQRKVAKVGVRRTAQVSVARVRRRRSSGSS